MSWRHLKAVAIVEVHTTHIKLAAVHQGRHARHRRCGIVHKAVDHLIVEGLAGLLRVKFARIAVSITAVVVIHAIGDITRLLDFGQQISSTDGMNLSCRNKEYVPSLGSSGVDDVHDGVVGHTLLVFLR